MNVQQQNADWVISVSDTGMWIPKEVLPRIFERFYRVNRPGIEIQGTGLGLAIVHKIVTLHGGRIEVESEADRGAVFTVFLPINADLSLESLSIGKDEVLENTITESSHPQHVSRRL